MGIGGFHQSPSSVDKGKHEIHRQLMMPRHADREGRPAYAQVTTDKLPTRLTLILRNTTMVLCTCDLATET